MKALTICQPYAHLICLPDDDDRAKRVENRRWPTLYRGPLLIHAGKSREWLELDESQTRDEEYDIPLSEMTFGAIVGVCRLADCFSLEPFTAPLSKRRIPEHALRTRLWLAGHQHVEGPFCFVLAECRKFPEPIPYRGAQGLFEVPGDVVAEQISLVLR